MPTVASSASSATGVVPALPNVTLPISADSQRFTRCADGPRAASSSTVTCDSAFVAYCVSSEPVHAERSPGAHVVPHWSCTCPGPDTAPMRTGPLPASCRQSRPAVGSDRAVPAPNGSATRADDEKRKLEERFILNPE